ncbi:MAG: arylesterase, partial [Pseudomonadota bacterium]
MQIHRPVKICALLLIVFGYSSVWPADRVVVLGDSLSDAYSMPRESGWVYLLDQSLGDDVQLIDGSISGDTSSGAQARLDDLLELHQPQVLIVILGGNDGLRGLSPNQLRENLAGIIAKGQAAGAAVALMQIRLPANLGRRYLDRFEAVYPELAEQFSIPLWPFFLETLFDQPGMMMDDGIHPSEQAQPEIARIVLSHLSGMP